MLSQGIETLKQQNHWLLLLDKWNYILYYRDHHLNKHIFRGNILEVGCGRRGWLSLLLKSHFSVKVTTTDIDPQKVRDARNIAENLGVLSDEYRTADCVCLPFHDESFDMIVGNAVMHHVLPSIDNAACEFQRVLTHGGQGIFTGEIAGSRFACWLMRKTTLRKTKDEYVATCRTWVKAFEKAGFKDIQVMKEKRFGYNKSVLRDLYYLVLSRMPRYICLSLFASSCTITFKKY
jgi:ubiquinone/menaquinone biosynthesis C-methylase UbiE